MKKQTSFNLLRIITIALMCLMSSLSYGQNNTIKGRVTDSKNNPIVGVTVFVEGTTNGAVTDIDGVYTLSNVPMGAKLKFSYIGMKTISISVNSRKVLNIKMEEDSEMLDEVVVVGYGTQRKSDLTGSVSQLKADAYENQPVLSTSSALQGRVSGVSISNTSGAPGGQIKIRIRGANSVNNDNAPLIVLDGIAMASLGFQDINPYDIASIDILKDASATAVYGARGANGVVLVTTKKGKMGQMNVSFKSNLVTINP